MINPVPKEISQITAHARDQLQVPASGRILGRIKKKVQAFKAEDAGIPWDKMWQSVLDLSDTNFITVRARMASFIFALMLCTASAAQAGSVMLKVLGADGKSHDLKTEITPTPGSSNWSLPVSGSIILDSYIAKSYYSHSGIHGEDALAVGLAAEDAWLGYMPNVQMVGGSNSLQVDNPSQEVHVISSIGDTQVWLWFRTIKNISNNLSVSGSTLVCYDDGDTPCAGAKLFTIPLDTVGIHSLNHRVFNGLCCNVSGAVAPDISILTTIK